MLPIRISSPNWSANSASSSRHSSLLMPCSGMKHSPASVLSPRHWRTHCSLRLKKSPSHPSPLSSPCQDTTTREQLFFLPPSHGSLRKKRVGVVGSHGGCRETGMGRRESQLPLLPPSGALFGIRERGRRRRQEGREDCHPLPAFGNFRVVAGMGCVCSREGGAMWTLRGGDAPGIG